MHIPFNPDSAPDDAKVYIPKIHVDPGSSNVVVDSNIVSGIAGSNWTGSNNLIVQHTDPNGANYYGDLFVNGLNGGNGTLDDFIAVPGGIIEQMNVGASLTHSSNVVKPSLPIVPSHPSPTPTNVAPNAQDDYLDANLGTSINIDVLANDSDSDRDHLQLHAVGNPTNGIARIGPNNTIIYTPNSGYSGSEKFSYQIADGKGGFDSGEVHINVLASPDSQNSNPSASDDFITTASGRTVQTNILRNDLDADGDTLTTSIIEGPENGTVSLSDDGSLKYTPLNGFSGIEKVTYSIDDGNGGQDTAMVYITVQSANSLFDFPGDQLIELTSQRDNVRFFNRETDNVSGMEGDDHIRTTGGDDVIDAGSGNDVLRGGNGADLLIGGTGDDKLFGGNGQDIFYGGEGRDTMKGNYKENKFADKFVFTLEDLGWVDRIVDFGVLEGDHIDVSRIFEGTSLTTENVGNYLKLELSGGGTLLSYDIGGKGDFSGLVEIDDTFGIDLQSMIAENSLVIN